MSLVTLVSGGIDSTVMALLAKEEGVEQYPLFIDYGQLSRRREWEACRRLHARHGLPRPKRMALAGFGGLISSGLTRPHARVNEDAFLPGRNLLFLLAGAAYAREVGAGAVAIGLLDERYRVFPDQTTSFLAAAEQALVAALGDRVRVIAPLMGFSKSDTIRLARAMGVEGTYSCHAGQSDPCGTCISCRETAGALRKGGSHGRRGRKPDAEAR
jgi:7-cyano-7-deazaguanine synthase